MVVVPGVHNLEHVAVAEVDPAVALVAEPAHIRLVRPGQVADGEQVELVGRRMTAPQPHPAGGDAARGRIGVKRTGANENIKTAEQGTASPTRKT